MEFVSTSQEQFLKRMENGCRRDREREREGGGWGGGEIGKDGEGGVEKKEEGGGGGGGGAYKRGWGRKRKRR